MRWGIIGCGDIALKRFVPALRMVPGAELVAVQNRRPDRTAALAAELGCSGYPAAAELVADPRVEAVYIASPNYLHHTEVLAAAAAGKHILVEKPIANSLAEAREMIRAAAEAGVTLMVANMMRFNVANRAASRLVRDGAIGRPVAARCSITFLIEERFRNWRIRAAEAGSGPLADVGVHALDTLRYILGAEVEQVAAVTADWAISRPHGGDTEDTAALAVTFSGGVPGSILVSFAAPFTADRVEIYGTEGMLWTAGSLGQASDGRVFVRTARGEQDLTPPAEDIYAAEIRHFEQCVRTGEQPLIDGREGARDLAAVLAAIESARSGRTVRPTPWAKAPSLSASPAGQPRCSGRPGSSRESRGAETCEPPAIPDPA